MAAQGQGNREHGRYVDPALTKCNVSSPSKYRVATYNFISPRANEQLAFFKKKHGLLVNVCLLMLPRNANMQYTVD